MMLGAWWWGGLRCMTWTMGWLVWTTPAATVSVSYLDVTLTRVSSPTATGLLQAASPVTTLGRILVESGSVPSGSPIQMFNGVYSHVSSTAPLSLVIEDEIHVSGSQGLQGGGMWLDLDYSNGAISGSGSVILVDNTASSQGGGLFLGAGVQSPSTVSWVIQN